MAKRKYLQNLQSNKRKKKAKNIMILDTETSGLPSMLKFNTYFPPEQYEKYNTSRLIEIGYIICGPKFRTLKKETMLVKPDNFVIKNSHIHGITHEEAEIHGISFSEMMNIFQNDLQNVSIIVAHNMNFDYNILMSELYRNNLTQVIEMLQAKIRICTMRISMNITKQHIGNKFPRLLELYYILHGKKTLQNHRALDDAILCFKCYKKLRNIQGQSFSTIS